MGSAQVQGELWGQRAADWVNLQEPGHRPLFAAMLDAAAVDSTTKVLDIGCGGGPSSKMAAERGAQITAPALIDIARSQVPDGTFHVGDMESLPFDDDNFDTIIAANALQYAANRDAALQEFKRVCDARARVVIGLFGSPDG